MTIKCELKFDQPNGVWFVGQIATGVIELTTDSLEKVKGICLKIRGAAECQWHETEPRSHHHRRESAKHSTKAQVQTLFSGNEDYINTTTYLVGPVGGEGIEILPGIHTYNFSCVLPHHLPSSFEGTHGHIRYTVRVVLERPWKFDQTYKVAFTVLKPLDLNYESQDLRRPVERQLSRTFWCWPCKSGPLTIFGSVPQTGYVSGQSIPITVHIDNATNHTIEGIKYKLQKIVTYTSQTPRQHIKIETKSVVEKTSGGIGQKESGRFQQNLLIPAIPPTNVSLCRVIQIRYELKVKAKVSGPPTDSSVTIPIVIGTVPLVTSPNMAPATTITQQPASLPGPSALELEMVTVTTPTAPSPETPIVAPIYNEIIAEHPELSDMPPPSYEESVYGTVEIDQEQGESSEQQLGSKPYAPRYPVYTFNQEVK